MPTAKRTLGRRLTPTQAAIALARQMKSSIPPRRFAAKVSSVTNWETNGYITCTAPLMDTAFRVQARTLDLLEVNDYIWVVEDQGAQELFTYDGFVIAGAA